NAGRRAGPPAADLGRARSLVARGRAAHARSPGNDPAARRPSGRLRSRRSQRPRPPRPLLRRAAAPAGPLREARPGMSVLLGLLLLQAVPGAAWDEKSPAEAGLDRTTLDAL